MTSLPMPSGWPDPLSNGPLAGAVETHFGNTGAEDEQFLLRAFRSFARAADSLERSYGLLRAEVERLRQELEQSHSDLAQSLEENRGIREHLDRILEGLPCGVVVVSGDGEIARVNPEALRLLGFESAGVMAGSVSALPAAVRQLMESARQQPGEQELHVPELHVPESPVADSYVPDPPVPRDGNSARWLAARHSSIVHRAARSSVFILRDVSERKALEEAQARLRRDEALAEMSAVLAHEIRNPLGSLELFAGLLAESELDQDCRHWVEHVQAGLRTLAGTVNNVLHFHSLPALQCVPVDLGRLLEWAGNFFLPLARRSRVTLSLQNQVAGVFLTADRHRLEQVLSNLVLNALRAMPGGGWIELGGRLSRDGKTVSLAVADTGPGISPGEYARIFEAGFSTRAGSPGLGLAVCRKIVEQHQGAIAVSSPPGRGATFTLTFPLTSTQAALSHAGGWRE
jgi:PAS domain S-box-containing protein